jgi:hypothetical protein
MTQTPQVLVSQSNLWKRVDWTLVFAPLFLTSQLDSGNVWGHHSTMFAFHPVPPSHFPRFPETLGQDWNEEQDWEVTQFVFFTSVEMQRLKDNSVWMWSRCWKYFEKWTRSFVRLDPGLVRRRHCLGHLFLLNRKRNNLLFVPRYPIATLSTSSLNDPSFTTHDLLFLLWQSSPYSDILT